jgi:hypothetical protein
VQLRAVPQLEGDRFEVLGDQENCKLVWKLSRADWHDVLEKISALEPHGHQYFDYEFGDVTVFVSFKEGLRHIPFPTETPR